MTRIQKIALFQRKGYDYSEETASELVMVKRGNGGFISKVRIFNNETFTVENGYNGKIRYYKFIR